MEVLISEDKLHAASGTQPGHAAVEELDFPFTPIAWISIGVPNEEKPICNEFSFCFAYLHTCMFYTLISSPKAYVVVFVSALLAISHTWAIGETLGAEMKNPVMPC